MARIPEAVAETFLSRHLQEHLRRVFQGKVRDTYELPDHPDKLLVVATDRISAFDIVADSLIPGKGIALTTITVKSLLGPLRDFRHHLLAWGSDIDAYLPVGLHDVVELYRRGIIVQKLLIQPYEAVVRGYLTGKAWEEYCQKENNVWGHQLPVGLKNGDKFESPIFTPSTKAQKGHDIYINIHEFRRIYGQTPERLALELYEAQAAYAEEHDLIQADTKFEFGFPTTSNQLVVGDEVNTPDSSRYWPRKAYLNRQPGKLPPSLDKQFVRDYLLGLDPPFFHQDSFGRRLKVSELEPENDQHAKWFQSVTRSMPNAVVARTAEIYAMMPVMLFGR